MGAGAGCQPDRNRPGWPIFSKKEGAPGRVSPLIFCGICGSSCRRGPGTPGPRPPLSPLCRCGATLPPVATPRLKCAPLKSPPAGGHHRAGPSQAVFRRPYGRLHAAAAGASWGLCFGPVGQCFATNAAPHWPPLPTHRPQREATAPWKSTPRPHPVRWAKTARRCVPPSPPLLSKWGQDGPLFAPRKERLR